MGVKRKRESWGPNQERCTPSIGGVGPALLNVLNLWLVGSNCMFPWLIQHSLALHVKNTGAAEPSTLRGYCQHGSDM